MKEFCCLVNKYSLKNNTLIKKICAPLELLGISNFTYFSINEAGDFKTLGCYAEQLEFYYEQELYLSNPYLVSPKLLRSGNVFTKSSYNLDYLDTISLSELKYKIYNPFLIIEKSGDLLEGYHFSTTNPAPTYVDYLQNINLLKKFTRHFYRETKHLIGKIGAEKYNLVRTKEKRFFERQPNLPLAASDEKVLQFLEAISPLSERERQCLDLFQMGHSAQSTAAVLNLSPRTVEHYFEKIKLKLGCHSKWDLLNH